MAFTLVIPRERVSMEIQVIPLSSDLRKSLKGWGNECDLMLALIEPGRAPLACSPPFGRRHMRRSVPIREARLEQKFLLEDPSSFSMNTKGRPR